MSRPNTIFGCALIGINFNTPRRVQQLLDQLKSLEIDRLDTAARYSPSNPHSSEKLLGEVRAAEQGFIIDTKIDTGGDGSETLTAAAISDSMNQSAARLKVDKVHTLYLHRPDPQTPIAEQAAEINRLYLEGRFEMFGLSNFSADLAAEFLAVCEEKGFVKPSVYQGLYNLLSRESEESLFPLLRKHGIVFNAYSPLAGGFLTGNATRGNVEGTRYAPGSQFARLNAIYDKPDMHASMIDLLDTIEPLQITGHEACLRWLYYHSALVEGDGVILGASKVAQMVQNMNDIDKGPLPVEIVQKIQILWERLQQQ